MDQVDFNLWVQDSFIGIYSSFRIIYKSMTKGIRLLWRNSANTSKAQRYITPTYVASSVWLILILKRLYCWSTSLNCQLLRLTLRCLELNQFPVVNLRHLDNESRRTEVTPGPLKNKDYNNDKNQLKLSAGTKICQQTCCRGKQNPQKVWIHQPLCVGYGCNTLKSHQRPKGDQAYPQRTRL